MRLFSFISVLSFIAIFACNPDNGPDNWELITQTDEGTVCLDATSADADGSVSVWANFCLSSSCSRNAEGSCTATLDGTTITVTSEFEVEENNGEEVACTDDCGTIEAVCGDIGPLAAGTYTIVHGESSEEIEVPTTTGDCVPFM